MTCEKRLLSIGRLVIQNRFLFLSAFLLLTASPVFAGIDEANSAYDKGNYQQAFSMYKEYAEQGDPEAQYDLGLMFYYGEGVSLDLQQAVKWVTESAENGFAYAQLFLGGLYFEGKGVNQDYEASVKWYFRAAQKGNVDAEYDMGYMYENGFGVPIDCDKAQEWYGKAADQGDEESQEVLENFTCRDYANVASLGRSAGLLRKSS